MRCVCPQDSLTQAAEALNNSVQELLKMRTEAEREKVGSSAAGAVLTETGALS